MDSVKLLAAVLLLIVVVVAVNAVLVDPTTSKPNLKVVPGGKAAG